MSGWLALLTDLPQLTPDMQADLALILHHKLDGVTSPELQAFGRDVLVDVVCRQPPSRRTMLLHHVLPAEAPLTPGQYGSLLLALDGVDPAEQGKLLKHLLNTPLQPCSNRQAAACLATAGRVAAALPGRERLEIWPALAHAGLRCPEHLRWDHFRHVAERARRDLTDSALRHEVHAGHAPQILRLLQDVAISLPELTMPQRAERDRLLFGIARAECALLFDADFRRWPW